jgi:hypothetical protein
VEFGDLGLAGKLLEIRLAAALLGRFLRYTTAAAARPGAKIASDIHHFSIP